MTISDGHAIREIQFSTISEEGVLTSYSTYVEHDESSNRTRVSEGYQNTLQTYTAIELKHMLEEHGFRVLAQTGMDGEKFSKNETERILTVAKRVS